MNTYYTRTANGTAVRLAATFYTDPNNPTGSLADPGAVTYATQKPDGTAGPTGTATKDSTGTYHADVDIAGWPGGFAKYVISGTSPLEITLYGTFAVVAVPF